MTKLGGLRVDFEGDSKDLDIAAAKAKASLASVGTQAEQTSKKQAKATKTTIGFGNSMASIGQKSGLAKGGLRNLTFQLQDIIVQMQMGTRTSTILSQQLPQLGASFGSVGLIAFSLAGALAAVGGLMLATSGDAREFSEIMDDAAEAVKKYREAVALSAASTDDLRDKFGSANPVVREMVEILEGVAKAKATDEIDSLTAAIADFVNGPELAKMLGIKSITGLNTKEERDAIKASIRDLEDLRAEFAALEDAVTLQEKSKAAQDLLEKFQQVALVSGDINLEEQEFIDNLATAIIDMEVLKTAASGTADEIERANEFMDAFGNRTAQAAREMALLKDLALAASVGLGGVGPGRGGDPRGESGAVRQAGGVELGDFGASERGGRRGQRQSPLERDLERLEEQLATEIELQIEQYATQQELLREALENELITRQEFEALTEKSKADHLKRMENLDKMSRTNQINMAQGIFGDLASMMDTNNKKLFKIGKVAAIAESLISTYKGVAKALELPFPYNLVAAAVVAAKGLATVSKIRSTSMGGGGSAVGGGVGGGAAPAAATDPARSSFFDVNLQGEGAIPRGAVRDLIGLINDEIEDGAQLRGIRVS